MSTPAAAAATAATAAPASIVDATREYVKKELAGMEGSHDFFHILRVYNVSDRGLCWSQ